MKQFLILILTLTFLAQGQYEELRNTNSPKKQKKDNSLAISLVIDGGFASQSQDPEEYRIPGFAVSEPEGRLEADSFFLGHNELTFSGNIDDSLFGQSTIVFTEHEGETAVELEEFFVESIGLGQGISLRAGRFLPSIGYLNENHSHNDIFVQRPLVYQSFLGGAYIDDGLQASVVLPTDNYIEFGAGIFAGKFPANVESGHGSYSLYARVGGDINSSSSWRLGASFLGAKAKNRTVEEHGHGEEEEHEEGEEEEEEHGEEALNFTGDSNNVVIDFKYQWAPQGNLKRKLFELRGEWFWRNEKGIYSSGDEEPYSIDSPQNGFYVQFRYKWNPHWSISYRYDKLNADNGTIPEEAGAITEFLDTEGLNPQAHTVQIEFARSEFSRWRLGYSSQEISGEKNNVFYLTFTAILGDHGAHKF